LILIWAEALVKKMGGKMNDRKTILPNTRKNRMHVSFITRKVGVDGSRRSPGLRVRM
jgi:hypothetical protein